MSSQRVLLACIFTFLDALKAICGDAGKTFVAGGYIQGVLLQVVFMRSVVLEEVIGFGSDHSTSWFCCWHHLEDGTVNGLVARNFFISQFSQSTQIICASTLFRCCLSDHLITLN